MAPMTVRCGGTWEDGIFYEGGPKIGRNPHTKPGMEARELTASAWDPFAKLMTDMAGVDLVVGLGALWRKWGGCDVGADGVCPGGIPWEPANAAAFIKHNREAGHRIWAYELGNEPGVWNWTWGVPIVTPKQHAADYAALRAVLAQEYGGSPDGRGGRGGRGGPRGPPPRVVGPDTTWGPVGDENPDGTGRGPIPGAGGPNYDYWNATLQQRPAVDVAAFHYYSVQPGTVRSWRDFANVARSGSMCTAVAAHAKDLASSPLAGKVPLWLGEGGAAYGGFPGAHVGGTNWLRLFGGGLSYLEDLGCAASNGAQVFARQQLSNFITGNASEEVAVAAAPGAAPGATPGNTIGQRWTYTPQPAWWVSILWKKLVGTAALATTVSAVSGNGGGEPPAVHAFAFNGTAAGQVVVALVNWDTDTTATQSVAVHGCAADRQATADVYLLTPAGPLDPNSGGGAAGSPADSVGVAINGGKEAKVDDAGNIPAGTLDPRVVPCEKGAVRVDLAGLTGAFVVMK